MGDAAATTIDLAAARAARPMDRGDHVELAERVVAALRTQVSVVFVDGNFYNYDAKRGVFAIVDSAQLSRVAQRFAGVLVELTRKPLSLKASDVSGAIKLAASQVAQPDYFDDAKPGIAFANAFVELSAGGVAALAHAPAHRARFAFDFDFAPDALPEMLLGYFEQVFRDDGEEERACKIALVQEYIGISLLGLATRYQRVIVFVGDGANGKGVLSIIIDRCMPRGSVCAIPPQDLGQEYRRALLAGKLLNIVSELPEADILDSESWKAIVAGDPTTGREIRKEPFTFRPIAGHIYSANRLPGTADQTHGFWRRIIVVQFGRVFEEHEQDPMLADRIVTAERAAIVSWALRGAQRVLKAGRYTVPPSSAAAVSEWQRSSDAVRAFIEERCDRTEPGTPTTAGTKADDLYRAYREWTVANGHKPLASNKFGARMKAIGLPSAHTMVGNFYPVGLK
jgi:putative DNA primase/helicase